MNIVNAFKYNHCEEDGILPIDYINTKKRVKEMYDDGIIPNVYVGYGDYLDGWSYELYRTVKDRLSKEEKEKEELKHNKKMCYLFLKED